MPFHSRGPRPCRGPAHRDGCGRGEPLPAGQIPDSLVRIGGELPAFCTAVSPRQISPPRQTGVATASDAVPQLPRARHPDCNSVYESLLRAGASVARLCMGSRGRSPARARDGAVRPAPSPNDAMSKRWTRWPARAGIAAERAFRWLQFRSGRRWPTLPNQSPHVTVAFLNHRPARRAAGAAALLPLAALALMGAAARPGIRPASGAGSASGAGRVPGRLDVIQWPDSTGTTKVYISIDSIRVLEGDAGTKAATFTVRLSDPLESPGGTLNFATEDRTAEADSDYIPVSGKLELNAADISYTIVVPVIGDTVVEGNERFAVRLSNPPPGAIFVDSIGVCTIVNDERARFVMSKAGLQFFLGALGPAFGDANGDGYPDLPLDINFRHDRFGPSQGLTSLIIP